MFKTILVPTSGSSTDPVVFATALAVGRYFEAHLQFVHVHLSPTVAAREVPHFEFCQGPAISTTLEGLRNQGEHLLSGARKHFEAFCRENQLRTRDTPDSVGGVTASLIEEADEPVARLLSHARHSDLIVLGRRHSRDHLPSGLIESVLVGSGRPILIAHESPPRDLTGTIVVGWKETPEAARALAAALPLLKQAQRVILLGVAEDRAPARAAYDDLARQLTWHGINAEVAIVGGNGSSPAATILPQAVAELRADLLVVGGFGRTPLRELVFGGVTQSLINSAAFPVFILH
jgi:nucleotide-binding universal stress UspA family protein